MNVQKSPTIGWRDPGDLGNSAADNHVRISLRRMESMGTHYCAAVGNVGIECGGTRYELCLAVRYPLSINVSVLTRYQNHLERPGAVRLASIVRDMGCKRAAPEFAAAYAVAESSYPWLRAA